MYGDESGDLYPSKEENDDKKPLLTVLVPSSYTCINQSELNEFKFCSRSLSYVALLLSNLWC